MQEVKEDLQYQVLKLRRCYYENDIAIMADPDTVTGFMLGGIKSGFPVHNKEEAKTTLKQLVDDEYSIIITTEKLGMNLETILQNIPDLKHYQ